MEQLAQVGHLGDIIFHTSANRSIFLLGALALALNLLVDDFIILCSVWLLVKKATKKLKMTFTPH